MLQHIGKRMKRTTLLIEMLCTLLEDHILIVLFTTASLVHESLQYVYVRDVLMGH
jgi:hypothetical protein